MREHEHDLTASYYRCRRDSGFLDTFYDAFLSKSSAIAAMFVDTEFKLQKLMLRQSLLDMICFDRGTEGTHEEIKRLGYRHSELNITDEMYAMWVDSLCEALEKHDPCFDSALEQRWRSAMNKSIQEIVSHRPDGGSQPR